MGTLTYLDQDLIDQFSGAKVSFRVGTTGHLSKGPQLFIKVGSQEAILSHEDAAKLCSAIDSIARYLDLPHVEP